MEQDPKELIKVVDLKKGRWADVPREELARGRGREPARYINAQMTPVAQACALYPYALRLERARGRAQTPV